MIYVNEHIDQLDIQAALAAVSEQRRQHAMRYRQERDRRLSLAAYLLLCKGLKEEYGITSPPEFVIGDHGKPMLVGYPHIHFNMSHCREAAVCAISSRPVGIDAESIRQYNKQLVERTMNKWEQQNIENSLHPDEVFIRLWTMKESVLKLTGEGISNDLHTVLYNETHHRFITEYRQGYIITMCEFKNN